MRNRKVTITPALFVVDVQNCFMAPRGSYGKMGFSIKEYRRVIPRLREVIAHARRINIPVFFSKAIREASGIDNLDRVHKILPAQRRERIKKIPLCIRGTWDSEIIHEIDINPKRDHIVEKRRDSAFRGTELEVWLKALGVDTLIFAGVDTSICVESTLRDAFNIGYDVILLSDASASHLARFHEATLDEVQENFGLVMTADAFFKRLKKRGEKFTFRL